MTYCPKCGTSTKLINESGAANLSCPSCGVVWEKFLEAMANDALWPSIVSREKHEIVCPKCGYERYSSDGAIPRTKCPSCHVDYAESLRPPPLDVQNADTKACEFCGEKILAVAKKCKHCGSVLVGKISSKDQAIAASKEVEALIRNGKTVEAIYRYQAESGVRLTEARSHVNSLVVKYRLEKAPPPKVDSSIACPKCRSTNITAEKKGFSVGKAVAGAVTGVFVATATGGFGALAGGGALLGIHGRTKIRITCLKCGHAWIAGK